jgi:hypothetical protein
MVFTELLELLVLPGTLRAVCTGRLHSERSDSESALSESPTSRDFLKSSSYSYHHMGRNIYIRSADDIIRAGHDPTEFANTAVEEKLDRESDTQ